MAELKTTRNLASVAEFLAGVADPQRRADAQAVCALITEVTGATPAMWGGTIVGFGSYRYVYASGRQGDGFPVGLSPRKQALTVYLAAGLDGYGDLLGRLGPHRTGTSCLYLKRLAEVDEEVFRDLIGDCFRRFDGTTVVTESS